MSPGTDMAPAADLFFGGGDAGARMRAFEWSRNPLGPVGTWSRNLRTCVRIILTSRQPMFVWWGPRLINLYNDAYRSILGGKHPHALGQPAETVWREIWDQVGPRAAATMSGREGTYDEALLLIMERNGYAEETYYTFSYSPVPDDDGGPGGILCANTDDTQRIVGGRRLSLLRELAARTTGARTPGEVGERVSGALSTEPKDIPFALLYLLDADAGTYSLAGTAGIAPGHPAAPDRLAPAGEGPDPWSAALDRLHGPGPILIDSLPADLPRGAWEERPSRAALVPIPAAGTDRVAGALVVGLNPFRPFDEDYRSFLGLVAGQIAASLATARAYEDERRRAEALAELDRAKSAFFSNVSHEFRTPLTLMLGPLEDALRDGPDSLPSGHRETLDMVRRNGRRLLKLVNNLLEVSRIEAGKVQANRAPTDLSAATAEAASMFRSAVSRAGLDFAVDCAPLPRPVPVDRDMWDKIVLNLLSNALKFTFEGGIRVELRPAGETVELRVADTGVGIPPEEVPRLFTRFHRVQGSKSRTHEGSGIGLALVQELARLHGGSVSVESALGRGTTFTVALPFPEVPDSASAGPPAAGTGTPSAAAAFVEEALRWLPGTGRPGEQSPGADPGRGVPQAGNAGGGPARILLADDNRDMRDYVERILSGTWRVEAVADGSAALAAARAHPPDLVLTDVMMPGLDGFQLLRALKEDPATASIPVILLSARAGEEAKVEGLNAGADDYMVKPFSSRELLARVSGRLEIARLRRQQQESERQHSDRLRASEALSQSVIARSPDCIKILDAEARLLSMNESGIRLLEICDLEPLLGGDYVSMWDETYRESVREAIRAAHAGGTGRFQGEFPTAVTGMPKWWDVIVTPLQDHEGRVDRLLAVSRDITAIRDAEREMYKFQCLVEESTDFIGIGDMEGDPLYINAAGLRLVGLAGHADYRTVKATEFYFPEDLETLARAGETLAQAGHWQGELRFRHFATGKAIPVWMNVFHLKDRVTHRPFAVATVTRDLSRLKETEEHLRQAQKMEAIGKLAGGIAHDFNNLLTAINGYADLALTTGNVAGDLREYLTEIQKSGGRAAQLTGQLLAYSRKQVLAPRPLDLNHVVSDMETMLRRLIGEHIEFEARLDPGLGMILADPGQIQQVILNLALNARDAMAEGGRLRIETASEVLDSGFAGGLEVKPGPYALLTVADSGTGMEPEVMQRIFEPFFTTKPVGKGTGMGLPSVYGIVRQSGGAILAESEPGRGSVFRIYLPLSGGAAPEARPAGTVRPPAGKESILLVEDEDSVRNFIGLTLRGQGYRVVAARDGEEALHLVQAGAAGFDLLLTDLIMPRMGGMNLARRLKDVYPALRVVFMSGYTDTDIVHGGRLDPDTHFLQKPFRPEALFLKLREVLDPPKAPSPESRAPR